MNAEYYIKNRERLHQKYLKNSTYICYKERKKYHTKTKPNPDLHFPEFIDLPQRIRIEHKEIIVMFD